MKVFFMSNECELLLMREGQSLTRTYTGVEWVEVKEGKRLLPYCPDLIEINNNGTITIYPPNKGYSIGVR